MYDKAISDYTAAINVEPENAYAYYETEIIKSIGKDKIYQVDESIFNSTTTKIKIS